MRSVAALCFTARASASLWTPLVRDNAMQGPAPRLGAATLPLAGDAGVAIAGGCSSSCCYAPLSDLWAFSGGVWSNVSQTGAAGIPSARLYHATASAGSPGESYMFGGNDVENGPLGDLWLVALSPPSSAPPQAAMWTQLAPAGAAPEPRSSHTMNALAEPSDGSFVLFGGETDAATLSDAWIFTPAGAGSWAKVDAAGDAGSVSPGERAQHAAVVVRLPSPSGRTVRALVVSGGVDVNGNDADDVWALALDAKPPVWILVGSSAAAGPGAPWPSGRHGHALWVSASGSAAAGAEGATASATTVTLGLFGGQSSSVASPSNFHADTWSFVVDLIAGDDGSVQLSGEQGGAFTLLDNGAGGGGPTGTSPGPRALGCAAQSSDGALLYAAGFSGYTGGTDDRLHNDVWIVNASAGAM